MAMLLGDNNYERGEGGKGKAPGMRLLTQDSESTEEKSKSFSAWKPVWYTGWHTGVLVCAASAVAVLVINVSLTIYAATNPRYMMEGGIGTLYSGSCDESKLIELWFHLGINVLSTLLLSGSNYTQQCLSAPTRGEIDASHAKREWMDIGVPSIRNLFRIKRERAWLWVVIGLMSIPLHLLYNSGVYTSLAANEFFITVVTNNHFEPGTYRNTTETQIGAFQEASLDISGKKYETNSSNIGLFSSMLEGLNPSTQGYEDMTPLECAKRYTADFLSNRRNLFLITNHSSNTTNNNTILAMHIADPRLYSPSNWICSHDLDPKSLICCDPDEPSTNLTRGLPWRVQLETVGEVEIAGCKSEITSEKCKVQFSLDIMIVVICCNLIKAGSMIMAVFRSREPTLVTLGDAVDSFLRTPDGTTVGMCFADQKFIKREWTSGWRTGPRQWKQKGVQRWWTSVSKTMWITCNSLCGINIALVAVFLGFGMLADGEFKNTDLKSMWVSGLGKVNGISLVRVSFKNITHAVLIANLPQTILSFLYLTYNSLLTCMLFGHEWSLFSHHHRTLRVTSPRPGQRSTYWLQIPYAYAIPIMTISGLLHWLTSQSIFLARVEIWDPFGGETPFPISTVGYSCIAIIFLLTLSTLSLLTAAGMGYKRFAADITTVGSCSAAISAACHTSEVDSEDIIGKKVRWGDVGIASDLGVRHLAFSNERGVGEPLFGEAYAGMVRKGE